MTDKSLDILVKLGVIGKDDVKAVNDLLRETAGGTDQASEATEKFNLHGAGMRKVIGELNHVLPGLGEAVHGVKEALSGGNAELIIAALVIKTVITYWELYQEKAKAAAETQAQALDKIREATRNVLEEQKKFNELMANAEPASPAYLKKLQEVQTLLEAQFAIKKKLLELDKQTDLAGAKTPEEKAAVNARYGMAEGDLNQSKDAGNITAITNERIALENQKRDVQKQVDAINDHLADMIRRSGKKNPLPFGAEPGEESEHLAGNITQADIAKASVEATQKIAALNKTLEELNRQSAELKDKYKSASELGSINADGRGQTENRPISRAVEGIDAAAHGQKLTAEQIKANAELTRLFSMHAGGIEQMMAIIRFHLQHTTTQQQEINALKTALANLEAQKNHAP